MRKNISFIGALAVFALAPGAWAQSLMHAQAPAPAGGSGMTGAPVATDPLDPGAGGLADFVDIHMSLPEGDLRSLHPSQEGLQRGLDQTAASDPGRASSARPAESVLVPPVPVPAERRTAAAPSIVSRETQSRVHLAQTGAEVRDAVASPASAPTADFEGQAALMNVLFDRAHLLDAATAGLGGETVGGSSPRRLAPPPISTGRIPGLRAAPEPKSGRGLLPIPARNPSAPPSPKGPDLTVGQLARGLGGALGAMSVDAAGAALVSSWYAPKVDYQGYRAIFGRSDLGAVRKTAYSILLPLATLLAIGLAPFAGGLWGLAHGWIEGKDRGFRFAIQGAREDVGMFKKNAGRLERLAKELADDAAGSLGAPGAGGKAASSAAEQASRRILPTIAGTVATASLLALLLAAVLFVLAKLLLAV